VGAAHIHDSSNVYRQSVGTDDILKLGDRRLRAAPRATEAIQRLQQQEHPHHRDTFFVAGYDLFDIGAVRGAGVGQHAALMGRVRSSRRIKWELLRISEG